MSQRDVESPEPAATGVDSPTRGVLAWFVRRTYYLLQMPGWSRRLRIMIDWTFAFLFRPDIVKISLDSETVSLLAGRPSNKCAGAVDLESSVSSRGDDPFPSQ